MASNQRNCYLAIPWDSNYRDIKHTVIEAVAAAGFRVTQSQRNDSDHSEPSSSVSSMIARADVVIADTSRSYPNVFVEIGQAKAMGKPIILLSEAGSKVTPPITVPEARILRYRSESGSELRKHLSHLLADLYKYPHSPSAPAPGSALPFFVDWDSISGREMENLCQELMSQLGFRQLRWSKELKEIDLVAEFPRKDPDGYEFKELWLVTMGRRGPIDRFLNEVTMEPEFLMHSVLRYSSHSSRNLMREAINGITFLIIDSSPESQSRRYDRMIDDFEERKSLRREPSYPIRIRHWDRGYLTSLVQQNQHIGFKYFSDEGRIRSESRKTFEDLYRENNELVSRQVKLISDLKAERDGRVRAERDSVWKDISFSAAHKIGNPIFAIETALDPLRRRVTEGRTAESMEVIEIISSATVKAKAFVEQFKSLTRAQKIDKSPCKLRPIILESLASAQTRGVQTEVNCSPGLNVNCDAERIAECFDELAANAIRWRSDKDLRIEVAVHNLNKKDVPDFLDGSLQYIKINFRDNGPGILIKDKKAIFEAFVTKYEHGTGLGLALVRRVVEGHGGAIIEVGKPGEGADFELYLPT